MAKRQPKNEGENNTSRSLKTKGNVTQSKTNDAPSAEAQRKFDKMSDPLIAEGAHGMIANSRDIDLTDAKMKTQLQNIARASGSTLAVQPSALKLLQQLDGRSETPSKRFRRTVNQNGKTTVNRRLALLCEAQLNEQVILPFGELSAIEPAANSLVQTYLSLIAMRYRAIPPAEWQSLPVFLKAVADEQRLNKSKGDSEFAVEFERALADAYKNASRKFIETSVIMPLLRRTLVQRLGISTIDPGDIVARAQSYASWKRKSIVPIVRQMLLTEVVTTLEADTVLESFSSLISAMGSGVPQSAGIGLPLLVKAIMNETEGARAGTAFTKRFDYKVYEGDVEGFSTSLPTCSASHSIAAHDIEGRAWILEKEVNPVLPVLETVDIAALIKLAATLQGINITDSLGLESIARYADMSILVMDADVTMSKSFQQWFDHYVKTQFLIEMTQLRAVDNTITALFDEPNRSDLHAHLSNHLYFYALSHKVTQRCIGAVLGQLYDAVDVDGAAVQALVKAIGVNITTVSPIDSYSLTQVSDTDNTSMIIRGRHIVENSFFVDKEVALRMPVMGSVLRTLTRHKAVNELHSSLERADAFYNNSTNFCCLLSNPRLNDMLPRLSANIVVKQIDEIPDEVLEKGRVSVIKANPRATEHSLVLLVECTPTVLTTLVIPAVDRYSYRTSEVALDAYDLKKWYNATAIEGGYKMWLTDEVFHAIEGETSAFDTDIAYVAEQLGLDLDSFIKIWKFEVKEPGHGAGE